MNFVSPNNQSDHDMMQKVASDVLDKLPPQVKKGIHVAAIPRYFNCQILALLLHESIARTNRLVDQIRKISFVQQYDDNGTAFTVFDGMRSLLIEDWKLPQNYSEYKRLNGLLADYYSDMCASSTIAPQKEKIEAIYHQIIISQERGFIWFEREFLLALEFGQIDYCSYLLRAVEANQAILTPDNKLWMAFYRGLLFEQAHEWQKAQEVYTYLETQDGWTREIRVFLVGKISELVPKTANYQSQVVSNSSHESVSQTFIYRLKGERDKAEKRADRNELILRLLCGILFAILLIIAIFLLPYWVRWVWLIDHPKKLGLQICTTIIALAISWIIIDKDKARRKFALGSIVIAAVLVIPQII